MNAPGLYCSRDLGKTFLEATKLRTCIQYVAIRQYKLLYCNLKLVVMFVFMSCLILFACANPPPHKLTRNSPRRLDSRHPNQQCSASWRWVGDCRRQVRATSHMLSMSHAWFVNWSCASSWVRFCQAWRFAKLCTLKTWIAPCWPFTRARAHTQAMTPIAQHDLKDEMSLRSYCEKDGFSTPLCSSLRMDDAV